MFSKVSFLVIALAVYTSYGAAIPTNILAQRDAYNINGIEIDARTDEAETSLPVTSTSSIASVMSTPVITPTPAVLPSSSAILPPSSAPLTSSVLQPASDGSGDEIVVGVTVSDGGDATQTVPAPLPPSSIAPSPLSSPSMVPPPLSSPSMAPPPSSSPSTSSSVTTPATTASSSASPSTSSSSTTSATSSSASPSTSSSATTSATTASSSTSPSSAPKIDKNKFYAIYRDGNNFLKTSGKELQVNSDQNFEFYSASNDESVRWKFPDGLPSDNTGGIITNQALSNDAEGSLMLGLNGDEWEFNLPASSDKSVAAKAKTKDAGITISMTGGKWVGKNAEVANAAYTWKIKEIKSTPS